MSLRERAAISAPYKTVATWLYPSRSTPTPANAKSNKKEKKKYKKKKVVYKTSRVERAEEAGRRNSIGRPASKIDVSPSSPYKPTHFTVEQIASGIHARLRS